MLSSRSSSMLFLMFSAIGSDDRAVVVVVGIRKFLSLIGNAGIEDLFNPLADEPGHMSVGQFGRIALRFTGDGFDTQAHTFYAWKQETGSPGISVS